MPSRGEDSKLGSVTSWFDKPRKYLSRRSFDIRIRTETVQEFTKGQTFENVLDIGCGDGSISVPLLPDCRKLTLIDLSNNMLGMARNKVPADRLKDVEFLKADFLTSGLHDASYDLVLCIGVLAHVDSPGNVIREITRVAKPGAMVILEFTDAFHPWGTPDLVYNRILRLIKPLPINVNKLRHQDLIALCIANALTSVGYYRYGLPPAGTHWVADQKRMYGITRMLFGSATKNRNKWMGNEFIYCFRRT